SVLLEFGRYAPFYQFVYMLPYFSTIRNPAKFTHPFNWSLVILFAYGIHGLCRRYLAGVLPLSSSQGERGPLQASAEARGQRGRPGSSSARSESSGLKGEVDPSPQPSPLMKGRGGRPGAQAAGSLSPSKGERAGVRGGGSLANFRTWWPKANSFE